VTALGARFDPVEVPAEDAVGCWLVREGCDPERIAGVMRAGGKFAPRWYAFADYELLGTTFATFPVLPPEHCTRCGCPDNHHTEDHTGRTYCHCLQCPGHTSTGPA